MPKSLLALATLLVLAAVPALAQGLPGLGAAPSPGEAPVGAVSLTTST